MAEDRSKTLGADLSVMRGVNRSLVLDLIRDSSPISRAEIAKAASLAKPTVSAIVDELLEEGLIREAGVGEVRSGGGRPPILLEFNERSHFVCGVHVGVQRTTVAVADARGEEIGRVCEPTPRTAPAEALVKIAGLVSDAISATGAKRKRLAAVGVCVPGLVDDEGTCLLAPNLGWSDVDVRKRLQRALRVPVFVQNTAQASAVAEAMDGAARHAREVVLLYAGSGVGAGILSRGRVLHGAAGITGEIGHCRLPGGDVPCSCGNTGCVETVASAPAIARAARAAVALGAQTVLDADATPEQVSEAAAGGDAVARRVLAAAGEALGTAASWIVNVCNPEVLVLGGGLAAAGEPLLGPFVDALRSLALPQSGRRVRVEVWALGQDAKVRGAVLLALQRSETYYRVVFQG